MATLGFNHFRHLEAYFAVPGMGAVLVPVLRRHPGGGQAGPARAQAGPRSLVELFDGEGVTFTAGVPTVQQRLRQRICFHSDLLGSDVDPLVDL